MTFTTTILVALVLAEKQTAFVKNSQYIHGPNDSDSTRSFTRYFQRVQWKGPGHGLHAKSWPA